MVRRKFCFDLLNILLLIASLAVVFLPVRGMNYFLSGSLFTLFSLRGWSPNSYARAQENAKVVGFFRSLKPGAKRRIHPVYRGQQTAQKADTNHRIFTCKQCKQKLRVPKGKGRIMVTCSNCGNKFTKKT